MSVTCARADEQLPLGAFEPKPPPVHGALSLALVRQQLADLYEAARLSLHLYRTGATEWACPLEDALGDLELCAGAARHAAGPDRTAEP